MSLDGLVFFILAARLLGLLGLQVWILDLLPNGGLLAFARARP